MITIYFRKKQCTINIDESFLLKLRDEHFQILEYFIIKRIATLITLKFVFFFFFFAIVKALIYFSPFVVGD